MTERLRYPAREMLSDLAAKKISARELLDLPCHTQRRAAWSAS